MKFDHDILFEFLPEEDKKSFMVWDNVLLNQPLFLIERINSVQNIVATYRAPFEGRVVDFIRLIPLDEYELRLKQKERDNKLNDIL